MLVVVGLEAVTPPRGQTKSPTKSPGIGGQNAGSSFASEAERGLGRLGIGGQNAGRSFASDGTGKFHPERGAARAVTRPTVAVAQRL